MFLFLFQSEVIKSIQGDKEVKCARGYQKENTAPCIERGIYQKNNLINHEEDTGQKIK
jgi:hypothetical protein